MDAVNRVIRTRLHSDVPLINQIAQYIIGAGGKRIRPQLVLLVANAHGYSGTHHHELAAVVELIALDDAEIKYSTVQNWYPGDKNGKGGIYNFVTKRGICKGRNSKITWTQVELSLIHI